MRQITALAASLSCLLVLIVLAPPTLIAMSAVLLVTAEEHAMALVGLGCGALFAYVIVKAHFDRQSPIDLSDLLLEEVGGKQQATLAKFTGFAGFFIGTWAFLYALIHNTLGDVWAGVVGFMTVCFGAQYTGRVIAQRERHVDRGIGVGDGGPP